MTPPAVWSVRRAATWWSRIHVMTRKELLQLFRDVPLVLFVLYAFMGAVYLAGSGITMQLRNAGFVVYDADQSFSSRELIHRFRPPYFRLARELAHPNEGLRLLDRGKVMLVLDIPPRFQESLAKGETTSVQLQVDTTNAPQGLSAASYGERIVAGFAQERVMQSLGISPDTQRQLPGVRADYRVWYNQEQNEAWFESLTELLRIITIFAVLLPGAAMVREKERGTVEQLFVSPLTPFQIMFPKVLAMTLVILIGTAASLFGILVPVFGVPIRGSLGLYFILTALFAFTTAGIGLFAATLANNQAQVGLMTIMVIAPMLLLSGTATPPEAMPEWVRFLVAFSPLRHYIDITFGIVLKGSGLVVLWDSVLAMTLLGGATFGLGVWRFRRQF